MHSENCSLTSEFELIKLLSLGIIYFWLFVTNRWELMFLICSFSVSHQFVNLFPTMTLIAIHRVQFKPELKYENPWARSALFIYRLFLWTLTRLIERNTSFIATFECLMEEYWPMTDISTLTLIRIWCSSAARRRWQKGKKLLSKTCEAAALKSRICGQQFFVVSARAFSGY